MFCFALFDSIKQLFKVLRLDFTARPLPPDYLEADAQGSPELSGCCVELPDSPTRHSPANIKFNIYEWRIDFQNPEISIYLLCIDFYYGRSQS